MLDENYLRRLAHLSWSRRSFFLSDRRREKEKQRRLEEILAKYVTSWNSRMLSIRSLQIHIVVFNYSKRVMRLWSFA